MADKPFRVLLDLTDLHIENFKYVWINVAPRELKTISDFKKYVLQKVNLERDDIKLFVRDGLLLEEETIIVLREEDTVKIQYGVQCSLSQNPEHSKKETSKSSRKRNHSASNISDLSVNPKRHKTEELVISNDSREVDIEKAKSKKKKKKSHSLTADNENIDTETNNCSLTIENGLDEGKAHKRKKKQKSPILEQSVEGGSLDETVDSFFSFEISHPTDLLKNPASEVNKTINSVSNSLSEETNVINLDVSQNKKSEGSTNNCPKKKRKRRRKRKQPEVVDLNDIDDANCNVNESKCEDEMMHNMNSFSQSKSNKSILINESNLPDSISTNTYVTEEKFIKTKAQSSSTYPKMSTPAQSNSCDNPSWHVSLMHTNVIDSIVSSNNSSELAVNVKSVSKDKESSQNSESNKNTDEKHYLDLPRLNSLPEVGTCIAYKTIELDENYSPAVTGYREGIVTSINSDTEEIEIELTKTIIKPGRTGKFENIKESDIVLPEIKKCDVVKWGTLISPKRISIL